MGESKLISWLGLLIVMSLIACLLIHSPKTSTLGKNINSELANVHEWTVANKITVNPKKSLALIIPPKITTSPPDIQLNFINNSVTLKDSVKY